MAGKESSCDYPLQVIVLIIREDVFEAVCKVHDLACDGEEPFMFLCHHMPNHTFFKPLLANLHANTTSPLCELHYMPNQTFSKSLPGNLHTNTTSQLCELYHMPQVIRSPNRFWQTFTRAPPRRFVRGSVWGCGPTALLLPLSLRGVRFYPNEAGRLAG